MHMHRPIRVLIVDDHAGIRVGLTTLIDSEGPRLRAVGAAASADEALVLAREHQPDVIVLDVNLGGEDGLALMPMLQRAARCEVIVLTSLADPHLAAHARRLGARACLHKTAPAADLIAALLAARVADAEEADTAPLNAGVVLSLAVGSKHPWSTGNSADDLVPGAP